ncbi:MAG: YraN family protein [Bacteroidales bacterium]
MAEHSDLGKKGEDIATRYLAGKGYQIIERNWRTGKDEIDIIAEKDKKLIIVEVKTRSTSSYGEPEESVTIHKQRFLIRAANEYVNSKEVDNEIRFDIISIIIESNKQTIRHIEDAFYPTLQE